MKNFLKQIVIALTLAISVNFLSIAYADNDTPTTTNTSTPTGAQSSESSPDWWGGAPLPQETALPQNFVQAEQIMQFLNAVNVAKPCLAIPYSPADYDLSSDLDVVREKFPDLAYRATIIEEPLNPEGQGKPGDDFYSKICYRNTLEYTFNFKVKTFSNLTLDKCITFQDLGINENPLPAGQSLEEASKIRPVNIKLACNQVQVLLSKGGTSTIAGYVSMIYQFAAWIGGLIAVSMIIVNGIIISASGGDADAVTSAKGRIIKSIAGLVLLFISALILYTVNPTYFTF